MKTTLARAASLVVASGILGTFPFLGGLAGCNSAAAPSTICEQVCTCEGCTQTETQACEAEFSTAEKLSGDLSCDDVYSAYADCLVTNMKCVGDKIDAKSCDAEAKALTTCAKTIKLTVAGNSACDQYKAKVADCCDKISDQSTKELCKSIVDGIDTSNTPAETCEAANAAYTCNVQ